MKLHFLIGALGHESTDDLVDTTGDLGTIDVVVEAYSVEVSEQAGFGSAPFKVDAGRKKLIVDLGNCVPEDPAGGARRAFGTMQASRPHRGD